MLVKFTLSIGYSGANREEEVELPDDWTEEQIQKNYFCGLTIILMLVLIY